MVSGARSKFDAPMFEPDVLRKQIYCIKVLATLLGLFGALIVIRRSGNYASCPPVVTPVADTFWSVHIKCCLHQKKTNSKRPMTSIRPAERQRKGRDQSSTKNLTSKTPRLHKVAKQHKASDRSVGNPKTNCIQTKSNKI